MMSADEIPSECIQDPHFVKLLATSLCSEIAESKVILTETNSEIEEMKENFSKDWEKRRVLKENIRELRETEQVVTSALESMERESKNRSIEIDMAKNRLDDATLREFEDRDKFKKILQRYHDTWQKYKAEYEELPLAIERQRCCIELKRLNVQRMVVEYKREELIKIMRQREKINYVRIRASLVDISLMVLERWNNDKHLENLKSIARGMGDQLKIYTRQVSELEKKRRLAVSYDTAKMPPPRLDFPFMRSIMYPTINEGTCSEHQRSRRLLDHRGTENPRDESADTGSVNTLMLEEMCADDNNDNSSSHEERDRKSDNVERVEEESDGIFPTKHKDRSDEIIIIDESADAIRHKLERLGIEKQGNSGSLARKQEEQAVKLRYVVNKSKSNDDTNNDKKDREDMSTDTRESTLASRRTVRWIDEFPPKKFASPARSLLLRDGGEPRSQIHTESTNNKQGGVVDDGAEYDRQLKNSAESPRTRELTVRISAEENEGDYEGRGNGTVKELKIDRGKRERSKDESPKNRFSEFLQQIKTCSSSTPRRPNNDKPAISDRRIYNSPATNEPSTSKTRDDLSEIPRINENLGVVPCGKSPKIRKIESVDYLLAFTAAQRERAINKGPADSNQSSPRLNYVPSYASSDYLSSLAEPVNRPETGNFSVQNNITGDLPSLYDLRNWCPRPLSEISFSSSSIVDKGGKNDNPKNHGELGPPPADKPNDNSQFAGFFTMADQAPGSMF